METGTPMGRWMVFAKALARVPARFPLPLLAAAVATWAAIKMTHGSVAERDGMLRIVLAAIFGFPALVSATLAGELRPSWRWMWALAGLAAVTGVWATSEGLTASSAMGVRQFLLIIAATALASSVAGLGNDRSGNWWRMNVGTLNAAILAGIFSGIVLIGLQLALLSANELFGLGLDRQYADVFWICSMFIGPGVFLGLLPAVRAEADTSGPGFTVWRGLSKYALVPLGLLYTGILMAYGVKILLAGGLPDGMVALPVLVLGAFGTAATLLLHPWRAAEVWARWFSRIYPVAYLVLSPMLFLSFAVRIGDYGVTAQRYLGLAAGVWFALAALVFLLRPGRLLCAVPLSLCLITLVAAVGPFSAARVSLASQSARLAALLKPGVMTDADTETEAASIVRYLANQYGASAVERFTGPLGLDPKASGWQVQEAALKVLGLSEGGSSRAGAEVYDGRGAGAWEIAGYRNLFLPRPPEAWPVRLGADADGRLLFVTLKDGDLVATAADETVVVFPLRELTKAEVEKAGKAPAFEWNHDGRQWKVLVLRAEWVIDSDGTRQVTDGSVMVLER